MSEDAATVFDVTGEISSDWIATDAATPLPLPGQPDARLTVPLARYLAEGDGWAAGFAGEIGVSVDAGEDVTPLAGKLGRIKLIALRFPAFSDGRPYSAARILRERLGYTGDLRAVGDILIDQIPHMLRCGFTSFEVSHEPTRKRLSSGLPFDEAAGAVPNYYQPAGDRTNAVPGRAWARRRA